MIVVKIEFHQASTGRVVEMGRAEISNDGTGSGTVGNYVMQIFKGAHYSKRTNEVWKQGRLYGWPRKSKRVGPWELLAILLYSALPERMDTALRMVKDNT